MTILRHTEFDTGAPTLSRSPPPASGRSRPATFPKRLGRRLSRRFEDARSFILSITENGYGKRTFVQYRTTGRGGQGIVNIQTSERNGRVVATFPVENSDEIMLVSDAGTLIRCPVEDIRVAGRNTQGVTLFDTADGERVVSVARFAKGFDEVGNGNGHEETAE